MDWPPPLSFIRQLVSSVNCPDRFLEIPAIQSGEARRARDAQDTLSLVQQSMSRSSLPATSTKVRAFGRFSLTRSGKLKPFPGSPLIDRFLGLCGRDTESESCVGHIARTS
jgi:hypothetical protein